MKCSDIPILHLSDLHIAAVQNGSFSNLLDTLIKDLVNQLSNVDEFILVISGDLIDKGNFTPDNISAVLDFFEELKINLCRAKKKLISIQIVPGNHDKKRTRGNTYICKEHALHGLIDYNHWQEALSAYDCFLSLCVEIHKIFNLCFKDYDNTFGVDLIKINNKNICFIRIDTAWCSWSENKESNYRKLRTGRYQIDELEKAYQKLKRQCSNDNEQIDLTIAISHHPINWLEPTDEELCNKSFLSSDGLDVDIILHGHVHEFSIVHSFNHQHSLLTLVTGVGASAKDKSIEHRYSLYGLNLANNSCDVIMKTKKANSLSFDYDYSVYMGSAEKEDNKITYPIRVRESHPFIRLNAKKSTSSAKRIYIDVNTLAKISEVSQSICLFSKNIHESLYSYKTSYLTRIEKECSIEMHRKLKDYLLLGNEATQDIATFLNESVGSNGFYSYLRAVCSCIVQDLIDCFPEGTTLRAHFRRYGINPKNKSVEYVPYVSWTRDKSDDLPPFVPKPMKWEGLLKLAYDEKAPMIASANPNISKVKTDWNDFITIIPSFYENEVIANKASNKKATKRDKYPLITFAISIKSNDCFDEHSKILGLLSFLSIDETISTAIADYIETFCFDVKNIL